MGAVFLVIVGFFLSNVLTASNPTPIPTPPASWVVVNPLVVAAVDAALGLIR